MRKLKLKRIEDLSDIRDYEEIALLEQQEMKGGIGYRYEYIAVADNTRVNMPFIYDFIPAPPPSGYDAELSQGGYPKPEKSNFDKLKDQIDPSTYPWTQLGELIMRKLGDGK